MSFVSTGGCVGASPSAPPLPSPSGGVLTCIRPCGLKAARPRPRHASLRSSFLPRPPFAAGPRATRADRPFDAPARSRAPPPPTTSARASTSSDADGGSSATGPGFDLERLRAKLGGVPLITDPITVAQKSRDYFWYSPILKEQLTGKVADFVAAPRSEEEVLRVLRACRELRIPVTARGLGTGNYGQAVPLARGCVLDLSGLNALLWLRGGVARVQAGMRMSELEARTIPEGWELRFHPSTRRTATIGGFVAGGSGGVGSINYGGLRDPGNIRGLRVVTMGGDAEGPKAVELRGPDCLKIAHAYGTNGIITEVELPLAPATNWTDVVFSFPDLDAAVRFAERLGRADGVRKKLLCVQAAPISKYFPALGLDSARAHVLAMLEEGSEADARALADAFPGSKVERCGATPGDDARGQLPLYEYSWNHTTLHALKYDKDVTYLQTLFPADVPAKVAELAALFGDEVACHLEYARVDGALAAFGLPLVRFATAERLREVIAAHERAGVVVFDPHTCLLEDGGMKQVDEAQLGYKRETDPLGLLNPGKMRAWEERYGSAAPPPPPAPASSAAGPSFALFASPDAGPSAAPPPAAAEPIAGFEPMLRGGRRRWRWEEYTTKEFHEMDMRRAVAVIPVGAVEQHGPHLPVAVDAAIAAGILQRVFEAAGDAWPVPLFALPLVPCGKSNEHTSFAGTLTLSAETLTALLTDLVESVHRAGVRKVVFLNSHGGQPQILDIVARDARRRLRMLVVRSDLYRLWATDGLWPAEEVRWGIHGGGIETSVMLHLHPGLVQPEHARDFRSRARDRHASDRWLHPHGTVGYGWLAEDLGPAGAVGDATDADAERGRRVVEQGARELLRLLEEVDRFDLAGLAGGTAFGGDPYREAALD